MMIRDPTSITTRKIISKSSSRIKRLGHTLLFDRMLSMGTLQMVSLRREKLSGQDTDSLIANGMSEVLTIVIYLLICKEIGEPAKFPGNEYFWNSIDDNSYAPSLADLTVFAASNDSCKNEAFNHVNGDVFVWKHIWQDFAAYFGLEVCVCPHHFEA